MTTSRARARCAAVAAGPASTAPAPRASGSHSNWGCGRAGSGLLSWDSWLAHWVAAICCVGTAIWVTLSSRWLLLLLLLGRVLLRRLLLLLLLLLRRLLLLGGRVLLHVLLGRLLGRRSHISAWRVARSLLGRLGLGRRALGVAGGRRPSRVSRRRVARRRGAIGARVGRVALLRGGRTGSWLSGRRAPRRWHASWRRGSTRRTVR